jgi:hypothetical protein
MRESAAFDVQKVVHEETHNNDRDENGQLYPAIIRKDGSKEYYMYNKPCYQSIKCDANLTCHYDCDKCERSIIHTSSKLQIANNESNDLIIVEFSDFDLYKINMCNCVRCIHYSITFDNRLRTFQEKLRKIWRHYDDNYLRFGDCMHYEDHMKETKNECAYNWHNRDGKCLVVECYSIPY